MVATAKASGNLRKYGSSSRRTTESGELLLVLSIYHKVDTSYRGILPSWIACKTMNAGGVSEQKAAAAGGSEKRAAGHREKSVNGVGRSL